MNDTNIATARTGTNVTVAAILGYVLVNVFGWDIDVADPAFILFAGIGATIVYRVSVILADLWPPLGYLFFGVRTSPTYGDS